MPSASSLQPALWACTADACQPRRRLLWQSSAALDTVQAVLVQLVALHAVSSVSPVVLWPRAPRSAALVHGAVSHPARHSHATQ